MDDNVLRTEEVVNDPLHLRRKKDKKKGRNREEESKQSGNSDQ